MSLLNNVNNDVHAFKIFASMYIDTNIYFYKYVNLHLHLWT